MLFSKQEYLWKTSKDFENFIDSNKFIKLLPSPMYEKGKSVHNLLVSQTIQL